MGIFELDIPPPVSLAPVMRVKVVLVTLKTIELLALAAPPETTEINYKSW